MWISLTLCNREQCEHFLSKAKLLYKNHPGWMGSCSNPTSAIAEYLANMEGYTIYEYMLGYEFNKEELPYYRRKEGE